MKYNCKKCGYNSRKGFFDYVGYGLRMAAAGVVLYAAYNQFFPNKKMDVKNEISRDFDSTYRKSLDTLVADFNKQD